MQLRAGLGLALVSLLAWLARAESDKIQHLVWTTDAACVEEQCRLEDSATLKALTTSCARERCSVAELHDSSFDVLTSRPLAVLLMQYEKDTIDAIVQNINYVMDVFVLKHSDTSQAKLGNAWVVEYGKRVTEQPVNILEAILRGTMGGIRNNQPLGSWENPPASKRESLRACAREFRRRGGSVTEEEKENALAWLDECLNSYEDGESTSEDNFKQSRIELWSKVQHLGVIPKNDPDAALQAEEYASKVWNEFSADAENDVWLSVSWVPIFDSYNGGLGHGDRSEALLLELVLVEPLGQSAIASAVISTRSGKAKRVANRKLLALVACEDDDLETVLSCVKRATPNIFRVKQVVWGMGFVNDHGHYKDLEEDWNADEIYKSHGEFLPKYEDIERRKRKEADDVREAREGQSGDVHASAETVLMKDLQGLEAEIEI